MEVGIGRTIWKLFQNCYQTRRSNKKQMKGNMKRLETSKRWGVHQIIFITSFVIDHGYYKEI